ncbi:hypothetical protein BBAD15_g9470 [Beauveria bassiana D1-5]|uniref:Uncharacterized protein n=1 Tax=Beauveria bassiana D1-5 TaxID=1245745 RepID=A0A0A2VG40_BEABA|nr:hypothetical protein BBAD15_g9470 [Beauveria bassiana D1-5]
MTVVEPQKSQSPPSDSNIHHAAHAYLGPPKSRLLNALLSSRAPSHHLSSRSIAPSFLANHHRDSPIRLVLYSQIPRELRILLPTGAWRPLSATLQPLPATSTLHATIATSDINIIHRCLAAALWQC